MKLFQNRKFCEFSFSFFYFTKINDNKFDFLKNFYKNFENFANFLCKFCKFGE